MSFKDEWEALERRFMEQVESDNIELGIDSSYVHNFVPQGPVDYVLIAMEPSTGVPGSDRKDSAQITRNFSWSVEDFILHYCIREYLCRRGGTYHLTDLAKGGMTTKLADKERERRYERWYPLLQEELRLLNKPGRTRVIAIGQKVRKFLKGKGLCDRVEGILHYARTAAGYRDKLIEPWRKEFPEFSRAVDKDAFENSIRDVLNDADMDSYVCYRPEGRKRRCRLTESRKKLMFLYKNRFRDLRDARHIVLNLGGD